VDRWGEADLARELHSWYVFGELAILRRPLTLHAIEIGQTRGGRRASPWTRGWKHPTMPSLRMRFAHKDGSVPKGWKPMYLADYAHADADAWVSQMFAEGVAQALVRHVPVRVPESTVCEDTVRQVRAEAARAGVLLSERAFASWPTLPMFRAACDGFVPCPYQPCCHGELVTDITSFGLYARRRDAKVS